MRAWWRLRAWWHANLYRPAMVMPTEEGFIVECSCGGHGQVRRNGDGTSTVTDATCPLWRYRLRCRPLLTLPRARTVQR